MTPSSWQDRTTTVSGWRADGGRHSGPAGPVTTPRPRAARLGRVSPLTDRTRASADASDRGATARRRSTPVQAAADKGSGPARHSGSSSRSTAGRRTSFPIGSPARPTRHRPGAQRRRQDRAATAPRRPDVAAQQGTVRLGRRPQRRIVAPGSGTPRPPERLPRFTRRSARIPSQTASSMAAREQQRADW